MATKYLVVQKTDEGSDPMGEREFAYKSTEFTSLKSAREYKERLQSNKDVIIGTTKVYIERLSRTRVE